jgi:uncharacterized OB-fold protein
MSLLESVNRITDIRSWQGEIPIQSRYTYGVAGERFFREIMDNARFLGTYCPSCQYTYVPPTMFCERCFGRLEDWVEVGSEGMVESFTVLHVTLDGTPLDEPDILALIQLDGADSVLVHRLGDVSLDELRIGMRVKAVFEPRRKRKGSILDIRHFAPVES